MGVRIFTKNNLKAVECTLKYILLLGVTATVHYCVEMELHIDGELRVSFLKFLINLLFEMIEMPLTLSYIYMLQKGKYRFKRYFSFFAIRYFPFTLLSILTVSVPWKICDALYAMAQKSYSPLIYVCIAFSYILSIVRSVLLFFKAAYPKDNYKCIIKKISAFAGGNIKNIALFNLKFTPWIIVHWVLQDILYYRNVFDPYAYVLLGTCFYGAGLILFPCYILSFKRLIDEFGRMHR